MGVWGVIPAVLVLVSLCAVAVAKETNRGNKIDLAQTTVMPHLTADNTIADMLGHPALKSFGRLILPWDNRQQDTGLRLADFGSLLPYHSNVNAADVVGGLNRIIDDAGAGKPVFYDIYSEDQKRREPALDNTGLFFFRGKPGAPFAVISPGGGFSYVGSVHEGFPFATEINKHGYNAFVLRYRAGYGGTIATQDLAAALSC